MAGPISPIRELSPLIVCSLMDFLIHFETMNIELPILHVDRSQVEFS